MDTLKIVFIMLLFNFSVYASDFTPIDYFKYIEKETLKEEENNDVYIHNKKTNTIKNTQELFKKYALISKLTEFANKNLINVIKNIDVKKYRGTRKIELFIQLNGDEQLNINAIKQLLKAKTNLPIYYEIHGIAPFPNIVKVLNSKSKLASLIKKEKLPINIILTTCKLEFYNIKETPAFILKDDHETYKIYGVPPSLLAICNEIWDFPKLWKEKPKEKKNKYAKIKPEISTTHFKYIPLEITHELNELNSFKNILFQPWNWGKIDYNLPNPEDFFMEAKDE